MRPRIVLGSCLVACFVTFVAPAQEATFKLTRYEKAVVDLVNQLRQREKLEPLTPDPRLFKVAREHAVRMAKARKLAHDFEGKKTPERILGAGYNAKDLWQQIAGGVRLDPRNAVAVWFRNQKEKEKILSGDFKQIGVGVSADSRGQIYYTQILGAEADESSTPTPSGLTVPFAKIAEQVLELTNQERKQMKLPPLKMNPRLVEAALKHSENMARQDKLAHVLDDKTPGDRIKEAGYQFARYGENVAYSSTIDAKLIVNGWMNSEGHRKNILHKDFEEIGIALARNEKGKVYWTQVFGKPRK
ncbi:MAG: hypothetical protein KatS3mg105_4174 [Gemmatales bacterium]|nr:MAG: hypothetical protein KatS3mg105_4174 [Gemmatales bacterium]